MSTYSSRELYARLLQHVRPHWRMFAIALAGMVLTGSLRPGDAVMEIIRKLDFPVLLAAADSYEVASQVHDIIVKTRPDDAEKIAAIRDLIAKHVDVAKLVSAL